MTRATAASLLLTAALLTPYACTGQSERAGASRDRAGSQTQENRVLDRATVLARQDWWDNRDWDWYDARIPFFESPDPDIDATYYYRWEVVTKHLVYGSPETGYTFTEFIDRPFWSGTYGSISCPLGHQFYEVRWLKDRRIIEDFSRYWFETPGAQPRSYSNWYGDAMWATYLVRRDSALLHTVLPHMEAQYAGWLAEHWDSAHAMFVWDGMHDGMEINIDSRQTKDANAGAPGYRPTLNSYLFADARALASAAALFGDSAKAKLYRERAASLQQRVQQELWDPRRQFFFQQFAQDEVSEDGRDTVRAKTLTYQTGRYAGSPHGRGEIGYVPWQFELPDSGYEAAWRFLMDTAYFAAPFGPTTTERHDPQFLISPRCCVWSGNSWPYATTQTLVALANLLNDYRQNYVSKHDYFDLLRTYTLTQRLDGRPYVGEAANPITGSWAGHNSYYHSEHYFHSGYVDLIITGLVGLRPRPDDVIEVNPLVPDGWPWFALDDVAYHGHDVSIVWDRNGTRYGRGAGLSIIVDGGVLANAARIQRLTAALPAVPPAAGESARATAEAEPDSRTASTAIAPGATAPARLNNLAVNNGRAWPQLTASYSAPETPYTWANDGHIWYHASPPNRWTNAGSPHPQEWLELDFGIERTVQQLKLYFIDDAMAAHEPPPTEDAPAAAPAGVNGSRPAAAGSPERNDRSTTAAAAPAGPPGAAPVVRTPAAYQVQLWRNGQWQPARERERLPAEPTGHRANTVMLEPTSVRRLRVLFTPRPGSAVGVSELEAWSDSPLPLPQPASPPGNLAFNARNEGFPQVNTSFQSGDAHMLNDGLVLLPRYGRSRWTSAQSPHAEDWVEVDFGQPQRVGEIELFLLADGAVRAPAAYRVEYWDGRAWAAVTERSRMPAEPRAPALNTVVIEPVATSRLRVVFARSPGGFVGLTEIVVRPPGE